jgi:hypothetical protein
MKHPHTGQIGVLCYLGWLILMDGLRKEGAKKLLNKVQGHSVYPIV